MELEFNKKIEGNFKIADFNLSHSELILRSEIDDFNNINKETDKYYATTVEIKFSLVSYLELSSTIPDIEFLPSTKEDYKYIASKYNKEIFPQYENIYKILSGSKTYYILAMDCKITHKYE